ncbi:MAG TPA: phosphate acyltransferase, partial [Polyangiaceae bacterium]|nr:phosphate acyltransferase [Polyangiaceae bacterium]
MTAVVTPTTDVAMAGAAAAFQQHIIVPIFVGSELAIRRAAEAVGFDLAGHRLVEAADDAEAACKGVALCRAGQARALMKGSLHTDVLMHAVLDRDGGLRGARRVSHVFVLDVPAYPRALLITDAAINIYPTLDEKVDIVRN